MTKAQTLFDKIWARHTILERPDGATLLHVARHLVHDGSRASFGECRRGNRLPIPWESAASE